jgi:C_GCAxxG_C_C family probable redox protein
MNARFPSDEQLVAEVRDLAVEAFDSGLCCAEAVAVALAKALGDDARTASRAATAFCGGMSRSGGPCGALTGAILGLSLAFGRRAAHESALGAYAAGAELVDAFEREFGARNCHSLLGCDIRTPEGEARFNEQRLYVRCERYTLRAAEIAATLLIKHRR